MQRFWRRGSSIPRPGRGRRRRHLFQRGQATLEILVVLIILIPLIFGSIELSRGIAVRAALDSGIGTAVRALAVDHGAWGMAMGNIGTMVNQNVFGDAGLDNLTIIVTDSGGTRLYDDTFDDLTYGAFFCIEGSVDYLPMIPLIYLGTDPITIRVKHCGVVESMD